MLLLYDMAFVEWPIYLIVYGEVQKKNLASVLIYDMYYWMLYSMLLWKCCSNM